MERAGYLSASDFGGESTASGSDKVNFQFTVVNGEFYRSRRSARGGCSGAHLGACARHGRLQSVGDYGDRYAGYGRLRTAIAPFLGMVSYRSSTSRSPGRLPRRRAVHWARSRHVYSGFRCLQGPRLQSRHPRSASTSRTCSQCHRKQTRFIGGVSYQLTPNGLTRRLGLRNYRPTP